MQVVLSQCSGSNRAGFSMVYTTKGNVRLDGVFNIISYDTVPKLQETLVSSEFKVNVDLFSHDLARMQNYSYLA